MREIDPGSILLSRQEARLIAGVLRQAGTLPGVRLPAAASGFSARILAARASVPGTTESPTRAVTDDEICVATTIGASDAARILSVTQRRICQLADEGTIPARKAGGRWLFNIDDVECYRDFRH